MSSTTPLEYRDAFVARVRQAGSMRTILNVPLQRSAAWTQVLTATMSVDEERAADGNVSAPDRALLRSLPSSNRLACDRQRNSTKSSRQLHPLLLYVTAELLPVLLDRRPGHLLLAVAKERHKSQAQ